MKIDSHPPGNFCWVELGTSNSAAAKSFYGALFGWTAADSAMPGGGTYTMLQLDGSEHGALYDLTPDMVANKVPPHWLAYVAVADVDEVAGRVAGLGGALTAGPMDIGESGRMAVVRDPHGAMIGLWQAKKHIGARTKDIPGTFTWGELTTRDVPAGAKFYTGLFGWTTSSMPMPGMDYTLFHNGEGPPVGGGFPMTGAEWEGVPPHWMIYFQVADCDASAAKAASLGGKMKVPPTDIPNVGRFAVLQDPQGAFFSILKLNQPAS